MEYDHEGIFAHGKVKAPCRNCKDRVLGCHGKCQRYADYKAALEAIRPKKYVPGITYNKTKF